MVRSWLAQAVVTCRLNARAIGPLRCSRVLGIFILMRQVAAVDLVMPSLYRKLFPEKTPTRKTGRLRMLLSQDFSVACQAPALPGVKGNSLLSCPPRSKTLSQTADFSPGKPK